MPQLGHLASRIQYHISTVLIVCNVPITVTVYYYNTSMSSSLWKNTLELTSKVLPREQLDNPLAALESTDWYQAQGLHSRNGGHTHSTAQSSHTRLRGWQGGAPVFLPGGGRLSQATKTLMARVVVLPDHRKGAPWSHYSLSVIGSGRGRPLLHGEKQRGGSLFSAPSQVERCRSETLHKRVYRVHTTQGNSQSPTRLTTSQQERPTQDACMWFMAEGPVQTRQVLLPQRSQFGWLLGCVHTSCQFLKYPQWKCTIPNIF